MIESWIFYFVVLAGVWNDPSVLNSIFSYFFVDKKEMNARSQTFEFAVEGRQISEVISCMFHTILFHRCVGKFNLNKIKFS